MGESPRELTAAFACALPPASSPILLRLSLSFLARAQRRFIDDVLKAWTDDRTIRILLKAAGALEGGAANVFGRTGGNAAGQPFVCWLPTGARSAVVT
jgi:hypothetical protein